MSRPSQIEYESALNHLLSRGNERNDIFFDDKDRSDFLAAAEEIRGSAFPYFAAPRMSFSSPLRQGYGYLLKRLSPVG